MQKKSSYQSAFFNVRVLIRLSIIVAGIFLALIGLGGFSKMFAQPKIGLPTTNGGSALDGFDPNANGPVYIVVVQPDGKILIGGGFTSVLGVTRNRIARLNPDGTLDTAFNPNANDAVHSIAVQADGKILAGGAFNGANSIGGQTRNRIARLDPITGLADSWDPNANSDVYAIALQADGEILAGGAFNGANSIGGQMRNRIARLDPTTGLADSFDPNATGPGIPAVASIVVQADGKILVAGFFISIGGHSRNSIARLDATTGLADSFDPQAGDPYHSPQSKRSRCRRTARF